MIFQEPMVSLNPLHTLGKTALRGAVVTPGMRKQAARGEILDCLERVGIRQAPRRWRTIRISSPAASASG